MSERRLDQLHTAVNHMSAVLRLLESGRISQSDVQFSLAIPVRRYLRAVYGGTTLSAACKFLWHVLHDDPSGEDYSDLP